MADARVHVAPSNTAQAESWDGNEGTYWTEHADQFDQGIAAHYGPFLDAAAINPTDTVVDIGCGTGQTTRDAARAATSGSALGVDLSSQMIEHARRLAAEQRVSNATFEQTDAQIHPFDPGAFDVAISRTGSMFFSDPVAAFSNIGRALRSEGRLVLLTWQVAALNEWFLAFSTAMAAGRDLSGPPPDAPSPFALSDPDRVRSILGDAGFANIELVDQRAPMYFGVDADDAFEFVLGLLGWMLDGLDEAGRARAIDGLRTTIATHESDGGVRYDSATWIITAHKA